MADISIRNLDDRVRDRLRVLAAEHGHSMEAEIRSILEDAVGGRRGLVHALVAASAAVGGVDLQPPARTERARAADLS